MLDCVGDCCSGLLQLECDCPRAGDEPRDVADCWSRVFQQFEGILKVAFRFSGMPYDEVGAERKVGIALGEFMCKVGVVLYGMAPVHGSEDVFAAALDGQVEELVDSFVGECVEKRFLVALYMARIPHSESKVVVATYAEKNLLCKFGEICADVEAVAGAVLPGQLDFVAAVIDEGLYLFNDEIAIEAFEAAFDKVCAAEGAGI